MWDSNLNCGIAREREEKKQRGRERENHPANSSNLRHCRPTHRTKDWANTRGELAGCRPQTAPSTAGGREAGQPQPEPERGKLSPRDGILYRTAIRLPVANQDFLGFWMVDIHQEGHSHRSAPQKRHRRPLSLRKPSSWDQGGDKTHPPPQESVLAKCLVAWAARTWEGQKTQAQLSLHLWGVPENLNLSGVDLGRARKPGPALDSSHAEQPGTWAL